MSASDDAAPPRSSFSVGGDAPVVIWALALLSALAAVTTRALEPALPGVWVGADHIITAMKLGGAVGSQLTAVVSAAVVVSLVVATVRSTLPAYLRAYSVGAGVLVILAVMIASAVKLPHVSRLVVAGGAALLVLLAARRSAQIYTHRAAALVMAAMAFAGLARIGSIVLSGVAESGPTSVLLIAARTGATLSMVLETAGILIALLWVVTQPRAAKPRLERPRWLVLALVLAAAAAITFVAHRGHAPEATGASVLVARAVQQLMHNPPPYTPLLVRGGVEILGWLVIAATLVLNPRGRLMAASVALALVARASLEVPLCAIALVIASLALALHPGPDLRSELAPGSGPPPDAAGGEPAREPG